MSLLVCLYPIWALHSTSVAIPKARYGGRSVTPLYPLPLTGWLALHLQAQNLRESLEAAGMSDVKVAIGLRPGSASNDEARACGFTESEGTLGEVFDVVAASDLVILLTSDASQARATTVLCPLGRPAISPVSGPGRRSPRL